MKLSTAAVLVMPVVGASSAFAQQASGVQPALIVNRLEQLLGGLNNGQRDVVRQIAETYVRDRGQNNASATVQFENGLRSTLAPSQFEQYQGSREFVLSGTGPRPSAAQGPRTQAELAGAIVTRLERTLGTLNNGQRDVARQIAETYVRDRGQNNASAIVQFENGLRSTLAPSQFEQYQSNRDFILNGGANRQGTGQAPTAGQPASGVQPALIVNRLEQLLGGLNNGQRDVVRQIAETYVRDRGQNNASATVQFENGLRSTLAPSQFEQYQGSREFVLSGTGPRPSAAQGPRTQAELAGAIVTRLERTLGTLNNGQRDVVRQIAETYVRDRGQNNASATVQFENGLRSTLAPGQFEQYQSNRDFILNGGANR